MRTANFVEEVTSLPERRSGYIASLDGWRAVAIVAIVVYHSGLFDIGGRFANAAAQTNLPSGVTLFFAISGLLICGRLLDEERVTGSISLRGFYLRRAFRIVPAMLLYLAVIKLCAVAGWIHVPWKPWLASAGFVANYYNAFRQDTNYSTYTNHFWTLAVEEHFYLLLPAVLLLTRRHRALMLAVLTAAFYIVWAWYFPHTHTGLALQYGQARTEVKLHLLLFPALVAVLLGRAPMRAWAARFLRPWAVFSACVLAAVASHWVHGLLYYVVLQFGFTLLVASTALHPHSMSTLWLEWAPLRWVGRLSYSLYLWQQLFFVGAQPTAGGGLHWLQQWPWNLLALIIAAIGSYVCVERPLLRLGHRIAPPATPGHMNLVI